MTFFIFIFSFFCKNFFSSLETRLDKINYISNFASKCFKKEDYFNIEYSKILKKYFALDFSQEEKNENYPDNLIYKLNLIEEKLSHSDLFLFDNKIDYKIIKSKKLLEKVKDESLSEILSLSFLTTCLLPNHSSPFFYNYANEDEDSDNFDNAFFEDIFSAFYILSDQIGSLKDNFLIKESEEIFSSLFKNKNYILYNAIAVFLDEKKFKKKLLSKNFEKTLNKYQNKYKKIFIENLREDFLSFEEKNLFNPSLKFLLKKETLFALYFIGRIGNPQNLSILKIDNNLKSLIAEFGSLARFIIDNLNRYLGEKKINWKNKKFLSLKKETIENFFESIIIFSSLDKVFFRDFLDIFSKKN